MKRRYLPLAFVALSVALPLAAHAGAGGVGNTDDASLSFEFARSTAAQILKTVGPKALFETTGRADLRTLYEQCRNTMFVGIVKTRFELVSEIPDGAGFHAIAQRVPGETIRISRKEMEKLLAAGTLNGPFMTALVIHEAGHDCRISGQPVDDSRDGDLNALGEGLIRAAGSQSAAHLLDLSLIEQVKAGKPVRFLDLSSRVREQLTRKYLDYIGDWTFLQHQAELGQRPAPASDFFADSRTSLFPGWASAKPGNASHSLSTMVDQILAPSFAKGAPFYQEQGTGRAHALPTALSCEYRPTSSAETASSIEAVVCRLQVSWNQVRDPSLAPLTQELRFVLDLFGNLAITDVRVL